MEPDVGLGQLVFGEWAGVFGGGEWVMIGDERKPLAWLLTSLYRCQDQMPSSVCVVLDMDDGATFAQAVRSIRARRRQKPRRSRKRMA
jgi:hypothetical protein